MITTTSTHDIRPQRARRSSISALTAAVLVAHRRGDATPPNVAMTLLDALIEDRAPRAILIDAMMSMGAERSVALLRRALGAHRDEEPVREIASAMLSAAFDGAFPPRDGLTMEQALALSTLARHPTLWASDTSWLARYGVGATRDALSRFVA